MNALSSVSTSGKTVVKSLGLVAPADANDWSLQAAAKEVGAEKAGLGHLLEVRVLATFGRMMLCSFLDQNKIVKIPNYPRRASWYEYVPLQKRSR